MRGGPGTTLEQDAVIDLDSEARDLVFVMKGRPAHRHAGNLGGPQPRHRRRRTRAADVDLDVFDHGFRLFGRELERQRPPRAS